MKVAFTIDELGLEGLGVTLVSLLNHCRQKSEITFFFLYANLEDRHLKNIQKLLYEYSIKDAQIEFYQFDDQKIFGHLPSLHGSWVCYGRLLIPQLIKDDKVLCLDSDLIINVDIKELFGLKINDFVIGAVRERYFGEAMEKHFLTHTLGASPKIPYFNMGVSLFNLKKWKAENLETKLDVFINRYASNFKIVDQTIFNAYFQGTYFDLDKRFNTQIPPAQKFTDSYDNKIIHLIGSPKPWDITGRFISTSAKEWYAVEVPTFWRKEYNKLSIAKLKRTWNIKNSILYNAYLRLKNELEELLTK